MNEFMVNIGLMTYGFLLLSELLIYNEAPTNVKTSLPAQLVEIVVLNMNLMLKAPQSTLGDLPKDFRLNMKRRPPIILGAH